MLSCRCFVVGIAVWELLTLKRPFADKVVTQLADHVRNTAPHILALPPETPPILRPVLEQCWAYDPEDRLEMDAIVAKLLRQASLDDLSKRERSKLLCFARADARVDVT